MANYKKIVEIQIEILNKKIINPEGNRYNDSAKYRTIKYIQWFVPDRVLCANKECSAENSIHNMLNIQVISTIYVLRWFDDDDDDDIY